MHTIAIQVPIVRAGPRRQASHQRGGSRTRSSACGRRRAGGGRACNDTAVQVRPLRSRCRGWATRCSTRSSSRWRGRTGGTATPVRRQVVRRVRPATRAGRAAAGALSRRVPESRGVHQAARRPGRDPADRHSRRHHPGIPELHRADAGRPAAAEHGDPADAEPPKPRRACSAATLAGFPNGRRRRPTTWSRSSCARSPASTIPLVDPSYTPDGAAALLTDGTSNTNPPYLSAFPYVGTPAGGYQTTPGTPAV